MRSQKINKFYVGIFRFISLLVIIFALSGCTFLTPLHTELPPEALSLLKGLIKFAPYDNTPGWPTNPDPTNSYRVVSLNLYAQASDVSNSVQATYSNNGVPIQLNLLKNTTYTLSPVANANLDTNIILDADTVGRGSIYTVNQTNNYFGPSSNYPALMNRNPENFLLVASKTSNTPVSLQYNDNDFYNNPVGKNLVLTTGNTGSGTLTLTVIRRPDKTAFGATNLGGTVISMPSTNVLTNAGSIIDLTIPIAITVQ